MPDSAAPLDLVLDGCHHVFLDCGANVGSNIASLFAPPAANKRKAGSLLRAFERYFGADVLERRASVCAIAVEPNEHHAGALEEMRARHRAAGWRTYFLPRVASTIDGRPVSFFFDASKRGRAHNEWGASIYSISQNRRGSRNESKAVLTLDIARLLQARIVPRRLPTTAPVASAPAGPSRRPPAVVVKMDIEGAEFSILSRMLFLGVLCQGVDFLGVEYHDEPKFVEMLNAAGAPRNFANVVSFMRSHAGPECARLELVNLGLRDNA